jgi:DNA mismatch repair protein MutS2
MGTFVKLKVTIFLLWLVVFVVRNVSAFLSELRPSQNCRPVLLSFRQRDQPGLERKTSCAVVLSGTKDGDNSRKPVAARAGSEGYSVLRQPAQWDVDKDPVFAIPESLNDDDDTSSMQSMEEWWSIRKASTQETATKSSNSLSGAATTQQPKLKSVKLSSKLESDEETLDLFQRSFNTLDFPRILNALYSECSTVPGKRIVNDAFTVSNTTTSKKRWTDGSSDKNNFLAVASQLAYQSLTADSVEGSQERYRSIQEMDWLLLGGKGTVRINDAITYRNRLGYKESLYYRPPPFMTNGFNFESILEIAMTQSRVLEGPDIVDVLEMIDTLENVQLWSIGLQQITEFNFTQLPAIANCIVVNTTLQALMYSAFDTDGRLNGTTFPTIGRLRTEVRSLKSGIMGTLDSLLAMPSIKSKITLESGGPLYSEVQGGRLVIPIDRKYASSIGIVHDTSRSGKTVYVEPNEIISSTNELRQIESELRVEESRVWRYLTEQILVNRVTLELSVAAIGQLDLIIARINLGRRISGTIPIVQDEGIMTLRNAQHPVLLLRGVENVVGSDIVLGANRNQGMILTGPNAGGKTVILKLLGLMALMARSGIPVPAAKGEISDGDDSQSAWNEESSSFYQPRVDFFNPVLADIGDIQSVGGDLSTFSGHMLVCREVLSNSGKNSLVLMDELGSGTDPNQGVAIAQALLEAVVEAGARVAITTHYMQLKQLAASDDRFSVAAMQFVNGRPTYKLLPGAIGESFALSVAERLGLPAVVLNRANALLDTETRQMGDLIREMEDQKLLVDQQLENLQRKQREMESMELEMKAEMIRLENQQLNIRRNEARKFAKMLEEKEAVLEEVLEKLKSDPSRRVVAKSWDDIKYVKRDAMNEAENIPSIVARKKDADSSLEEATSDLVPIAEMRDKPELKEGDKVVICERGPMFGREGSIIKALDSRIEIKVNNMNVSFKLSQLALVPTGNRFALPTSSQPQSGRAKQQSSRAKAVEQALAYEGNIKAIRVSESSDENSSSPSLGKSTMRTESNTVDVRGCNLSDAQEKVRDKFSTCFMSGRSVVYILHGHGTGGILKNKIRTWLKTEQLVKSFVPADRSDGGDAFTRVDLR